MSCGATCARLYCIVLVPEIILCQHIGFHGVLDTQKENTMRKLWVQL